MFSNQQIPDEFKGWFFEDGYFCTPEGDRFSPLCIRICFYMKQSKLFSHLLHARPSNVRDDSFMPEYVHLVKSESTGDVVGGGRQRLRGRLPQPAPPSSIVDCLGIDDRYQVSERQRGRRPSPLYEVGREGLCAHDRLDLDED